MVEERIFKMRRKVEQHLTDRSPFPLSFFTFHQPSDSSITLSSHLLFPAPLSLSFSVTLPPQPILHYEFLVAPLLLTGPSLYLFRALLPFTCALTLPVLALSLINIKATNLFSFDLASRARRNGIKLRCRQMQLDFTRHLRTGDIGSEMKFPVMYYPGG